MAIPAGRLIQDEDEGVKTEATQAYARLNGELPQDKPDPWWHQPTAAPWIPREAVTLPELLPSDPRELLALIGSVAEGDRAAVLTRFSAMADRDLRASIRLARVDGPEAVSVGACVVVQLLSRDEQVVPIRRLLPDKSPDVRLACANALAVIGKPSVIMGLRDLLTDPYPAVRCAGITALHALLPPAELARYTNAIGDDPDPTVQAVLADIRGEPRADREPEPPLPTQESA
jgi:hypothetical protein